MTRAPPLHDPARTPSIAGVLERNRRRGAPLAIAEAHRRECEAMHIPADHDLDIGV